MTGVHIQVLVFADCPHAAAALELAQSVAERLGPGVTVERVVVDFDEKAAALGFLGSASIRVEGADIEGRTTSQGAVWCRIYAGGTALPPESMVETA